MAFNRWLRSFLLRVGRVQRTRVRTFVTADRVDLADPRSVETELLSC
jgi:hypothetical protein